MKGKPWHGFAYRVYFRSNGTIVVYDLNDNRTHYPNEEGLPMWMQEKIAVLRMVETGVSVDGVGKRGGLSHGFYLDPPEENEV